jgi:glycerol uptake facilitator-like aquaporin
MIAVNFSRSVLAEFIGSVLLLAIVVGSGIAGERLAQGNAAIALLANALATGAGLYVLISVFAPISGAHFNPLVSLLAWRCAELDATRALTYIAAQVVGAAAGVALAHAMFGLPLIASSEHIRASNGERISEVVASAGLLITIVLGQRARPAAVPGLVACYIVAAYWFTASTSFANPAVTLARSLTPTFSGIAAASVGAFVLAQILGLLIALAVIRLLSVPEPAHL